MILRIYLALLLAACASGMRLPPARPRKNKPRPRDATARRADLPRADVQARVDSMTEAFDAFAARQFSRFNKGVEPDAARDAGKTLRFYLRIVAVSFLVRWFVVEPRYVSSTSMAPTFRPGDQIAVEKVSTYVRRPRPGEVILFRPPEAALEIERRNDAERARRRGNFAPRFDAERRAREVFVKRVVAGPGDVVEVRDRAVYVNGEVLRGDRVASTAPVYTLGPVTVPPKCLFVLGDNRNRSFDSHSWGVLPAEKVVGHVILRYWPLERFGLVEH
mmetsp:Transcript_9941/g.29721  ORF Transcript_9941/g.29721 Transcript_9941/m.29721 type:complete len:275 (-) Transcript_9941:7-831(-)